MKYTYEDIIINPNDPRLENAIGKKVYYSATIKDCIKDANYDFMPCKLKDINMNIDVPFIIEAPNFLTRKEYIIIKKEPEVKYVPFDLSKKEDRDFLRGKWIRHKVTGDEYQITVLSNNLAISCTGIELLKYYTFIDGTPVGKKVEE